MGKLFFSAAVASVLLVSILFAGAAGTKGAAAPHKPDLLVSALGFAWLPDGTWQYDFNIRNGGDARAPPSHALISFNNAQPSWYEPTLALEPGWETGGGGYSAGINPCPPGVTRGRLTVVADAYNEVSESNENNNRRTVYYSCELWAAAAGAALN